MIVQIYHFNCDWHRISITFDVKYLDIEVDN